MAEPERLARVALSRLSEPGDIRLAALVAELGAERVYQHLCEERDVRGVYGDVATRLRDLDPAGELRRAERLGIRFVVPGDAEWPQPVDELGHAEPVQRRGGAPLGLWLRGHLRLDEAVDRAVSVVGSRSATSYGARVAGDVAAHLGTAGVGVISGAAFGIDQAAHRGALAARGPTVAVLACGVDRAYPSAHRGLLDYIAEVGVVASELPPGCAPTKLRFLARNRLIAALARGTVVVEAAARSGALSTAAWTNRLNRVLMGVPGPVTSAPSEGAHELIRTRGAALVTCGAHVLDALSPVGSHTAAAARGPDTARDRLESRDQQLLDAVPAVRAAAPESIARTAGLPEPVVRRGLDRLATAGFVVGEQDRWRLGRAAEDGATAEDAEQTLW